MLNELYQKLEDRWIEMVKIRRFLHQHPELSFQEKNTAKYIADYYKKIGVPVQEQVGGNGVVARVEGALPVRPWLSVQTLTPFPYRMRRKWNIVLPFRASCTPVVMTAIPLHFWY